MGQAEGHTSEPPRFEWGRASSAGGPGPAYGVIGPGSSIDWIVVPPLDDETQDQWEARSQDYIDRLEGFIAAVYASSLAAARVAVQTRKDVEKFKQEAVPALREALQLIQEREPVRVRQFGCETC